MFRNNYDNDSVTFSPQGRIFQVEYAQEAVKQGSVVVGIVSKTHAVLAAIKVITHALSTIPTMPNRLLAKRRRTIILSEEDHRSRLPYGHCYRRSGIGRSCALKLHEATVP